MNAEAIRGELLKLAQEESTAPYVLKEPLVLSTVHMKAMPYSQYLPLTCNPDDFYVEGTGYKMQDSCGNEMFTEDRTQCALYYDGVQAILAKKRIDVVEDPVRYLRRQAEDMFMEIWDDEDAQEEIAHVKDIAGILAEGIAAQQ